MSQQQFDCVRLIQTDGIVESGPVVHTALLNISTKRE